MTVPPALPAHANVWLPGLIALLLACVLVGAWLYESGM